MANESIKNSPSFQYPQRLTPHQLFTITEVNINPKHWIPFVCPVFAMETGYTTSPIWHKGKQLSMVGICLGESPHHSRNVALVLIPIKVLVSSKSNVSYDPYFHTVP